MSLDIVTSILQISSLTLGLSGAAPLVVNTLSGQFLNGQVRALGSIFDIYLFSSVQSTINGIPIAKIHGIAMSNPFTVSYCESTSSSV